MKLARFVLPAAMAMSLSSGVHAQSVRGVVLDDGTSQPVAGAIVTMLLRGTVLTTARSDSSGAFLLFPRRSGNYLVRVTHAFYADVDSVPLTLESGETVELEIKLGRSTVPLEPLVVRARTEARLSAFQERLRQRPVNAQFLTRERIDSRPGARTTDLLRELPGIVVSSVARGSADQPTAPGTSDPSIPRATRLAMQKTTGICLPVIFVDGMLVRQYDDSSIDDFIRPEMLEGVEIYANSSAAPAGMEDSRGCGTVAFWTRGPGPGFRWSWTRAAIGVAGFALLVALTR